MRYCAYGAFNDAYPERGLPNHMTDSVENSSYCSDECYIAHTKELGRTPCSSCDGLYSHYDVLCHECKARQAR